MNFDLQAPERGQMSLDDALGEILQAELVRRSIDAELAYFFKHALVQDTAYATLLREERHRLHYRVAQTLELAYPHQLDELAARLAQHYAAAGDDDRTFEYALRAADVAVRRYGYTEAREYYSTALKALARLPDTPENRRRHVDAVIRQMRVTRLAVDPRENLAALERAEAITRSLCEVSEPAEGDQMRLARIHYWMGTIHVMRTELVEASDYLEMTMAAARELKNPRLEASAFSVLLGIMTMRGEFGKAAPLLTQEVARAEKAGDWLDWVYFLAMLSYSHAGQGYYALAVEEGERAIARARELNNLTRLVEVLGTVVGIYAHGGDIPKFLEMSRDALAGAQKSGERVYLFLYVQRAFAESRLGNAKAALAELRHAKEFNLGDTEHQFFADWLVAAEAEIALAAGQTEEAIVLAEKAAALARRAGGLYGGGFAERTWGLALTRLAPPRDADAEAHLAASFALFQKGDIRLEAARTQVAWGKRLLERGDHARAREHLEQAAAQFQSSGLMSELEEVQALIRPLST